MNSENEVASPATSPAKPKFRRFTPNAPRLSQEQAARQGTVAARAWSAFQDRDRVVAFLNTEDASLGGRPLDLAIASDEGLAAVTVMLAQAGSAPAPALATD
jgi:hypothetical protein